MLQYYPLAQKLNFFNFQSLAVFVENMYVCDEKCSKMIDCHTILSDGKLKKKSAKQPV